MMLSRRLLFPLAAGLALGAAASFPAVAQGSFPNRPITLVVPFTPSSGSDIIARIISPRLSVRWGQPVIVDNRAGASGNLGSDVVAKAAPDGHTLLMMINTFTMTPAIYKKLPFDPVADFAPVAELAQASFAFAVNPALPVTDMKSLVALVKANPGKYNYASPGNGTPHHLTMELLKSQAGLNVVHVPYKGISGAITELMGGQVQMMFASTHSLLPQVKGGKIRLLAVTSAERSPLVPEVPTLAEQGFDKMEGGDAWYGVMAPGKTPAALVARLHADFVAVVNEPEVKAELAKVGLAVQTSTPEELGALVKADLARWVKVVNAAGITAD